MDEQHAAEKKAANDIDESLIELTRKRQMSQREQNRWEWIRHLDRMADNHAKLSEDYRARADALLEEI